MCTREQEQDSGNEGVDNDNDDVDLTLKLPVRPETLPYRQSECMDGVFTSDRQMVRCFRSTTCSCQLGHSGEHSLSASNATPRSSCMYPAAALSLQRRSSETRATTNIVYPRPPANGTYVLALCRLAGRRRTTNGRPGPFSRQPIIDLEADQCPRKGGGRKTANWWSPPIVSAGNTACARFRCKR